MKRIVGFIASVSALGLIISACSSSTPSAGQPPNPAGPVPITATSTYTLATTAAIPGVPVVAGPNNAANASWVDISIFDTGGTGFYLVADKPNGGITEINPATNLYVTTAAKNTMAGFGPTVAGNRTGGPNGIITTNNGNIFVGDGNSNLQVVNTATGTVVSPTAGCKAPNLVTTATSLPGPAAAGPLAKTSGGTTICGWYTGGFFRLDEGAFDPTDGIVVMGNDEDNPPFLTFFSSTACATTTATAAQCILGKVPLPTGSAGLEQPVWDTAQKVFLISFPSTPANPTNGEIDVVTPTGPYSAANIVKSFPAPANCAPAGLALKQSTEVLLIGCGGPNLTFMSATTGAILGQVAVGGSDEVWYNPTDDRFYAACSNNTLPSTAGGTTNGSANPVAAVMDGTKLTLITVLQTTASAHSIAADPVTNKLFVPVIQATGVPNLFPGGVAIYTHN